MRKPVASLCLLFAWFCANGALLESVQVFAWAKMFAGYTETMSVGAALRETFDPAKPCEMCVGVAAAKETARQQLPHAVERAAEKLTLALDTPAVVIFEAPPQSWPAPLARTAVSRIDPVPVPPPRA